MAEAMDEVLIVALSARALAESAALAGFRVHAVDAYGDMDLVALADVIAVPPRFRGAWSPAAAVRAARAQPCHTIAYGSTLENHPAAVERLAARRRLWGNPPEVLRRVRDPFLLADALRSHGLPAPAVSASRQIHSGRWLSKPRRSGGGHGIRTPRPGELVPPTRYLQQRIEGTPGSITFATDGRQVMPLGLSLQLVGRRAFGAAAFRYCGSLLCGGPTPLFDGEAPLLDSAVAVAEVITRAFGLRGVNGIDFMARDGAAWVLEVNPRYSASMELVERAHGMSIFGVHAAACEGGLPSGTPIGRPLDRVHGKAVVYARHAAVAEPLRGWRDGNIRDVPHPGERIAGGRPVCTVFAEAATADACIAALEQRAEWVYLKGTRADRSAA